MESAQLITGDLHANGQLTPEKLAFAVETSGVSAEESGVFASAASLAQTSAACTLQDAHHVNNSSPQIEGQARPSGQGAAVASADLQDGHHQNLSGHLSDTCGSHPQPERLSSLSMEQQHQGLAEDAMAAKLLHLDI